MKRKIDAVKMVRTIRDQLYEQTKGMTKRELVEFYRNKAAKAQAGFKRHQKGKV